LSWRVTLRCTRAEAEALPDSEDLFAFVDQQPVIVADEPDPHAPDDWLLHAYFAEQPTAEELAVLRQLAADAQPDVEEVAETDWVTLSQAGLEPIRAGRFFVHTPGHRDGVPADTVALEIDAGRAFGTGHHETTTGCLLALERLKAGGLAFRNIVDLGTGTGLLAFAALRLWPAARVAASDIDAVAIDVASENTTINHIATGRDAGAVELITAAGVDHERLQARAPYDLILANILAGPLIELAPSVSAALAPGGRLVLAGLLDTQADAVAAAYRRGGLMLAFRIDRGDWPTLVMRKRKALGWQ
jgi:ribosomal protein L11 methyltransferase